MSKNITEGSRVRVPASDDPTKVVQVGYIEDEDEFPVKLCEAVSFGGTEMEALCFDDVELVEESS
jgi:hypothetical protein